MLASLQASLRLSTSPYEREAQLQRARSRNESPKEVLAISRSHHPHYFVSGTIFHAVRALAEESEGLPGERRMPEANHRTWARARIAAMIRERANERTAGREGKDCARDRGKHEAERRTARRRRAPEDKEDRVMEAGNEGREHSAEGCRSKEHHAPRRQPLGGAPPPPPPQPRQTQARVGRRVSRSNTGAPAKPREGIG